VEVVLVFDQGNSECIGGCLLLVEAEKVECALGYGVLT
jgi:hypothetical protein